MSISNKKRLDKEAIYKDANSDVRSVCSGLFYNRAKKAYEQCKNCANCFKYKSFSVKAKDTPEVRFHYIESFRKCDIYTKNDDIIRDNILTAIYKILYLNELALSFIRDIYPIEDVNDKEAKKLVRAAKKRQYAYEEMMKEILKQQEETYLDFCGNVDDVIEPIAKEIRKEFYELYLSQSGKEIIATRVAYINTAIVLCSLATKMREAIVAELAKVSKEAYNLQVYNLKDLRHVLQDLLNWEKRMQPINLNCKEACNIIKEKTALIMRQLNSSLIYKQLKKLNND